MASTGCSFDDATFCEISCVPVAPPTMASAPAISAGGIVIGAVILFLVGGYLVSRRTGDL